MTPRSLVLALLLACNIPTEEDVREATGDAVDQCRAVLREEVPHIVAEVTVAALAVCTSLGDEVSRSRTDIAYAVLTAMGCSWDGTVWDCATATICGGSP